MRRSTLAMVAGTLALSASALTPLAVSAHTTRPVSRTVQAIKRRGVLDYAWGAYFPYAYQNVKNGRIDGIDIALGEALARHMGVKLHLVQANWSTIVAGIPAGRYQIIQPIIITPQRAKVVAYSDPVWIKENTALVRASDIRRYPTLKSLNRPGVTIDVVLGSAQDALAPKVFPRAHISAVQTEPDSLLGVLSGRATAMFDGNDTAMYALTRYKGKLAMVHGAVAPSYSAFAVAKGATRFVAYLNRWIIRSRKDGLLLHLLKEAGLNGTFVAK